MPEPLSPIGNPIEATVDGAINVSTGRAPRRQFVIAGLKASYFQYVVSLIVGFVSTPLYLRYLGGEQFGLWLTLWSIVNYLSVSTVSMSMTGAVRIAESYAQNDDDRVSRVLVTNSLIWFGAALVAAAILGVLIAAGVIRGHSFVGSQLVTATAIPVLIILAAGFLLSQPLEAFRVAVRNFQRVDIEQFYTSLFRVGTLVAGIATLALGGGLVGLAFVTCACQLGLGFAFVKASRRLILNLRLSPNLFDAQLARSFLVPSVHFLIISAGGAIIWGTDNLVISINLDTALVTPYAVAMQLLQVGFGLIPITVSALMPTITALHVLNDEQQLRRVLKQVVKIGFALLTLLAVGFASFGIDFIHLWVGREHTAPLLVFSVLLAIFLIRSFAMPFEMVVVGTLKHSGYAYVVLIEAALNLTLSLILVRRFGLLGVAMGTLIAHAACNGWFLPAKGVRIARCTFKEVIFSSILPIAPAGITAVIVSLIVSQLPIEDGWLRFITCSCMTAVAYLVMLWSTGMTTEEKNLVRLTLKKAGFAS